MNRILKVFASSTEQDALADKLSVIERYDGFALVEASPAQAKSLARTALVEDVTDLYEIPIVDGEIDTSQPRIDTLGATRPHDAYSKSRGLEGKHHYLVQFVGPIKDAWLRGVKRAGGEPRELHSNFAYVVRADDSKLAKIASLPYVRWVGHLPYRERIADPLYESLQGKEPAKLPRTRELPGVYTVEFFGPDDARKARAEVKRLGAKILAEEPSASLLVVDVQDGASATKKIVTGLSKIHGVKQIRRRALNRPSNDVAAGIMGTAVAMNPPPGLRLSGKGEKIGVCDTGIDTGEAATIHADFKDRILGLKSFPIAPEYASLVDNPGADDGPADLDSGHGTHVSGSVLGSGVSSTGLAGLIGLVRGCSHGAQLYFQAIEQEMDWKSPVDRFRYGRYLLTGIPTDLKALFLDAYRKGVRIHSNSWGGGDPGAYDDQCTAVDEFVWTHKDFCILFAAGNDGSDADGDGRINLGSVTSPGTAKNCITIGATENRRTNFTRTYGEIWPDDYPVPPWLAARVANDPTKVVPFSSRGPTADGRFKPDVAAPGTYILSTRSTMIAGNNMGWAAFPPSRLYFHMSGTSMATPLTAGAVGLLRQYLRTAKRIAKPSAALLKAALVAGAVRQAGTAPAGTIVDNHQGYGRVSIDGLLGPKRVARYIDVSQGLSTGKVDTRSLTVKAGAKLLRIVLAYTDFPGATLVNNLNLVVTAPDGKRYVGNQSKPGATKLDATNNVEVVAVRKPSAGTWRIDVVGANVPQAKQDFALVLLQQS